MKLWLVFTGLCLALVFTAFILAIFRLCHVATDAVHRLLNHD